MILLQNPERVVEGYTEEFEASFLELLRQSHPFSRVAAKVVYNDYIANKCALNPPYCFGPSAIRHRDGPLACRAK